MPQRSQAGSTAERDVGIPALIGLCKGFLRRTADVAAVSASYPGGVDALIESRGAVARLLVRLIDEPPQLPACGMIDLPQELDVVISRAADAVSAAATEPSDLGADES